MSLRYCTGMLEAAASSHTLLCGLHSLHFGRQSSRVLNLCWVFAVLQVRSLMERTSASQVASCPQLSAPRVSYN